MASTLNGKARESAHWLLNGVPLDAEDGLNAARHHGGDEAAVDRRRHLAVECLHRLRGGVVLDAEPRSQGLEGVLVDDPISVRPFDAITFSLGDLWP